MMEEKLGEILKSKGLLNDEELARAFRRQKGSDQSLGEVLATMDLVPPEAIARALAIQFGIPYFELNEEFRLEPEEVKLIPESMARRYCLFPVKRDEGESMTVVMKDPLDLDALDTVRSLTRLEVHKAVATEERILRTIDKYYTEEAHIERNIQDIVDLEATGAEEALGELDPEQLVLLANDEPVVRFVNLLLMQAVRDRASDIHFEPGEKSITIRLRVDGVLHEVTPPPFHLFQAVVTRIKILADMDIAERRLPLDGRFKFKIQEREVDIRVSTLPQVHGEKIVLRVLDKSSLILNMDDIGFEEDILARLKRILKLPHGIILLTGPTGSGKTTTLYGALSHLKGSDRNIQTVEDPVEYMVPGINQMAVKEKIGLDFANALRHILRQDPDIIMVGEMRDLETARIAMRAALTGHLVLSTLHTNDTTSAFSRLRDIGIPPYLIASTIKLVISQRLVRTICPSCKQPALPTQDELRVISAECVDDTGITFYRGTGCDECNHTGYKGRTALFEFLEVNDPIRDLILSDTGENTIRNKALDVGMETLTRHGLRKVHRGETTLEEIVRVWPMLEYSESEDTQRDVVHL